jgi:hypothetical protein
MTVPSPSVNPYAASEVAPTGQNTLARASFIIAIVLVVLSIVFQTVSRFTPVFMVQMGMDTVGIGILYAAFSIVQLIVGIIGFALGLVGVRRGDALVQAGIGIGVGGSVAIVTLVSLLVTPLVGLLY